MGEQEGAKAKAWAEKLAKNVESGGGGKEQESRGSGAEQTKNPCPRCGHEPDNMDQGGNCNTLMEDWDGTGTDCPCKCFNHRAAARFKADNMDDWPRQSLIQNIQVGTLDVEDKLSISGTQNLVWAGGPTTFSEGDSGLNWGLSSHHQQDCELGAILDLLMGTGRGDERDIQTLVEKVNFLEGEWCEFCSCNTNHRKTMSGLKHCFQTTMTALDWISVRRGISEGRIHVSGRVQAILRSELEVLGSYDSAFATFRRLGMLD